MSNRVNNLLDIVTSKTDVFNETCMMVESVFKVD